MRRTLLAAMLASVLLVGVVYAADGITKPIKNPKIHPALLLPGGGLPPWLASPPAGLPVTVRSFDTISDKQRAQLQSAGFVPLTVDNGSWLMVGNLANGNVLQSNIIKLASLSFVQRIEPAVHYAVRPMDTARVAIGADVAETNYTDANGDAITGKGVTLCVDDSPVDIFHPAFFKPDGGSFAWIDTNANGLFDAGVDAVDLNDNQVADQGETLNFFDANLNYSTNDLQNNDGVFQADLDYLFVDRNGDGVRNYGPAEGFVESDPAYGEQIFFVEDTNGNNKLDSGETITGLGSSKVKVAYFYDYQGSQIVSYTRGDNLINYPFSEDNYISHGTGTAGVSASGQRFHRLRGVAYEAELVLVDSSISYYYQRENDGVNMSAGIALCQQENARAAIHEYCISTSHPMDGSSNDAYAMTEGDKAGLLNVQPTCNYHESSKASRFRVPANGMLDTRVVVDQEYPLDGYTYMTVSFRWRQPDRDVNVSIWKPIGAMGVWEALEPGYIQGQDGIVRWVTIDQSVRGTTNMQIILYGGETGTELTPPYKFRIANNGGTPLDVWGFVIDDVSRFYYGLVFEDHASDGTEPDGFITTATLPSGADGGIGIGAHNHRDGAEGLVGYSGRGLRIDGAPMVHVTGTYAQMTPGAKVTGSEVVYPSNAHGNFVMFGGTSSSSPLMLGVVGLFVQMQTDLTGVALRNAIRMGADASFNTSIPDASYGLGQVVVPAILDALPNAMIDTQEPQAVITGEAMGVVGEAMVFSAAASLDDGSIISYRWTISDPVGSTTQGDGLWMTHSFSAPGQYTVNLAVVDSTLSAQTVTKTVTIIAADETATPFEPYGCAGGCADWQAPRCIETIHACACVTGAWIATDCGAYCAGIGREVAPCNDNDVKCVCGASVPADGDWDEELEVEIEPELDDENDVVQEIEVEVIKEMDVVEEMEVAEEMDLIESVEDSDTIESEISPEIPKKKSGCQGSDTTGGFAWLLLLLLVLGLGRRSHSAYRGMTS